MDLTTAFGKVSLGLGKLDGDNYHSWKFNMRMYLIGKDVWDYVDGTEKLPDEPSEEEKKKFRKNDNQALSAICLNVKPALQIYVRNAKTAKEAWDSLSGHFEEKTLSKKIDYRKQLYACKLSSGTTMEAHLNRLKTIAEHLEALKDPVSDKDLVMILVSSLPDSYNNFVTALESLKEEELKWTYVRDRLMAEYDRKKGGDGKGNSRGDDALYAGNGGNNFKGNGKKFSSNSKPWQKNFHSEKECHHCHQKGHIRRDCAKWKSSKSGNNGGGAATNNGGGGGGVSNFTVSQNVGVKVGLNPTFSPEFAFKVCEDSVGDDDWWIDSGASNHMSPNESDFLNYTEFEEPVKVNLADKSHLLALGSGDVGIQLYDINNRTVDVKLKNTLYIPTIQNKLFSVSSAVEIDGAVKFDKDGVTWEKDGISTKIGQKHGKLFKLNSQSRSSDHSCYLSKAKDSVSLWHQRFGHLNESDLKMLNNKEMVTGMDLVVKDGEEVGVCHGCTLGKARRFSFPKKSECKTTKPLQLIHSDLCGPMHIPSVGGSRYFVTYTDDYSRYVSVYMLKTKDEAYDKFVEYVELVENQLDLKVKKFRSDGGGEYVGNNFKEFCKSRGIAIEGSISYTPQQNGVAERMNRTLVEMARSMIHHANLPQHLWAEAVATAAYIRNRCPTSSFKGVTPYEMLCGIKPDVDHLRVFGCDVYVHIPDQKRRKLEKKAYKAVFAGYPVGKKGYKIFNPANNRFAYSRDVTFQENSFTAFDSRNLAGQDVSPFDDMFDISEDFIKVDDSDDERDDVIDDEQQIVIEDVVIDILDEDGRATVNGMVVEEEVEKKVPVVRKSTRESKAPDTYGEWANIAVTGSDPNTFKQAMKSPSSENWKKAMYEEFSSLTKHKTWDLVDLPDRANLVGCKWVFKTKRRADGEIDKFKSRLVAQGYSQEEGVDFDEVFAPVAKYKSIRTVLAIANQLNLDVHQMDVKTAFLNGDLNEDIYMKQPEGFVSKKFPAKVCKLNKSLYGLKQSARMWNMKIDEYLKAAKYTQSEADPCIYYRTEIVDGKTLIMIIAVYVDDTILLSNDTDLMLLEKKRLSERFEMDDRGEIHYILGMEVKRNREEKTMTISQKSYLESVLARFDMQNCNPVGTPLEAGKKFVKISDDEEPVDVRKYQAAIGSLNYAAIATRPDLSVAVSMLSQHMRNPSADHWSGVKRVLRYIRGTIDFGLKFTYSDNFVLHGFADADWAGCTESRKSTSGEFFQIGNCAVSWRSKKQSVVALSSCEAEYISLCSATQEVVWLRRLLKSIGFHQDQATTICEDNQGAICLSKNPKDHTRTKHVDVKFHFTRETIEKNVVSLEYCPTGKMLADTLTKGLAKPAFEKFRTGMGVQQC